MLAKVIPFRADTSAPEDGQLVSQEQLRTLLVDQEAAWLSFCQAHTESLDILSRIMSGARIEAGDLTFDIETRLARRVSPGEESNRFVGV